MVDPQNGLTESFTETNNYGYEYHRELSIGSGGDLSLNSQTEISALDQGRGYLYTQTSFDGLNESKQYFTSTAKDLGGSYGIYGQEPNLGALDDMGNPLEVIGDTKYDLTRDHKGCPTSITDAGGLTSTLAYDSLDRLVTATDTWVER